MFWFILLFNLIEFFLHFIHLVVTFIQSKNWAESLSIKGLTHRPNSDSWVILGFNSLETFTSFGRHPYPEQSVILRATIAP